MFAFALPADVMRTDDRLKGFNVRRCVAACFVLRYLKPQSNGEDNSPDSHEDESSHEHQPPAQALNQQVLEQTHKQKKTVWKLQ